MADNEFLRIRGIVQEALSDYYHVRETCRITDSWHKDSIENYARPFIHGYFTLAVVGKMNAGKSTFINALIGANILPTGHFQTTSVITYIEHGESQAIEIFYADDHNEIFEGDFKEKLIGLISVPEEYSQLPINEINRLISGGCSVSDILKKKASIEARTQCPHVPNDLWAKYIEEHPKSTIAKEVHIQTPLNESFWGWRIIDTPGVGAIGGIQDETKKLFAKYDENNNKLVDAIIFLQSGADNIEDETSRCFVEETFNQLTPDAKTRIFFILTKAAKEDFRLYKERIIAKAQSLYGHPFNIPIERLTYVDSLLHRFCTDVTKYNIDLSAIDEEDPAPGWDENDWEIMSSLISPIKKEIKKEGKERSNETIIEKMRQWSNFTFLFESINAFVAKEKENTLSQFLEFISNDINAFIDFFMNRIRLLKGGMREINKEREAIKRRRLEYNKILNKLRQEASIEPINKQFGFVDKRCAELENGKSIDQVRTMYLSIIEEVVKTERQIFKSLIDKFKKYCKDFNAKDLTLASIDFSALERQAEKESQVTDYGRPVSVKIKDGGFSSDAEYKNTYPHTKTDLDKKRRSFIALVIKELRKAKEAFLGQLKTKVTKLCDFIDNDINDKIRKELEYLKELEKQLAHSEEIIAEYESFLRILYEYSEKFN